MSPAITWPEFKPTRNCSSTPSRRLNVNVDQRGLILIFNAAMHARTA